LLGYKDISKDKDVEYSKKLTVENKIASIPVSVFYHKPVDNLMLRFCFAKSEETLDKAAEILNKI
jgi:methionine aminotransferase